MIKISRVAAPKELTDKKVQELTNAYISDNSKSVWQQAYIKEGLSSMSHNKCAYCECLLGEESKYMEVEHFLPKKDYPQLVVVWDNLLPACKRCNLPSAKGTHDPNTEPIINPTITNPKEHLYMLNYRIKGKTKLGKTTVDVLYLNDTEKLTVKRFKIGDKIIKEIEKLYEDILEAGSKINTDNNFIRGIKRRLACLLRQASPHTEYAATSATILLSCDSFIDIVEIFKNNKIWDDELEGLRNLANEIKLER